MVKPNEFETLILNLWSQAPGLPKTMNFQEKSNFMTGYPTWQTKNGLKKIFQVVPMHENLHAGRYGPADHVLKGVGAWGSRLKKVLGDISDHEKS